MFVFVVVAVVVVVWIGAFWFLRLLFYFFPGWAGANEPLCAGLVEVKAVPGAWIKNVYLLGTFDTTTTTTTTTTTKTNPHDSIICVF